MKIEMIFLSFSPVPFYFIFNLSQILIAKYFSIEFNFQLRLTQCTLYICTFLKFIFELITLKHHFHSFAVSCVHCHTIVFLCSHFMANYLIATELKVEIVCTFCLCSTSNWNESWNSSLFRVKMLKLFQRHWIWSQMKAGINATRAPIENCRLTIDSFHSSDFR